MAGEMYEHGGLPRPELHRESLSTQIFGALVTYIHDNKLPPGTALPSMAELCDTYGASRPVVREAISALEAVGLVERRNGRNTAVRALDGRLIEMFLARAIRQDGMSYPALMEVRAPLEIQAARLAAERITHDALADLDHLLSRMRDALHDTRRYPLLDIEFHTAIAMVTGNPALVAFSKSLRSQLTEIMYAVRAYREDNDHVGEEQADHERIAEALHRGDPDAAAAAMADHMATSTTMVRAVELKDARPPR